jgi:hypothetical protein
MVTGNARQAGAWLRRPVLNSAPLSAGADSDIGTGLRHAINALKAKAYDADSGGVRYERLRNTPELEAYRHCAARLRSFDPATLAGQSERLAFWVNLYNVLVVHAVIEYGIRSSVHEARGFFRRVAYDIGGCRYSLDDMEHGVLRRNRRRHRFAMRPFRCRDPRRLAMVERLDPRVHFALVCGSRSCPPIAVYLAEKIDAQLDLAAAAFLNGETVIHREQGRVEVSRLFSWYGSDFGDRAQRLRFIARYLDDTDDRQFLLDHADGLRLVYRPYDWNLNAA